MRKDRGWDNLPKFSKTLYQETYFLPNEDYHAWLLRKCSAYSNDIEHEQRMMTYIHDYWFHGSTPVSSNAGTDRGLPISCFTGMVPDSKKGIFNSYNEANWLGAFGGGLGWDWSEVREMNHKVGKHGGKSSGLIPFLPVSDKSTLAVSQGGLRRASQAVYLKDSHPEIQEFIDIRKPSGDQNRRTPNLHHGISLTDNFMRAVLTDKDWDLISPKDNSVIKTVKAREMWSQLMDVRTTLKGEPYLLFIDTVNDFAPVEYKSEGITITTSNLCTEITLRTDENHSGVCCLGSINLEYWDEYSRDEELFEQFIADCSDFLDNVIQSFIYMTEDMEDSEATEAFRRARNGAIDERSIGLGVMGFHSLLQSKMIPFESAMAKGLNINIFKKIKEAADYHNINVSEPCPMAKRYTLRTTGESFGGKRNIHVLAVAPTMSISSLCNLASSGIEAWVANTFVKKVKQGSFVIRNKYLSEVINRQADRPLAVGGQGGIPNRVFNWVEEQWLSINKNQGSVQHLEWMHQDVKDVFKTAFEMNQRYAIDMAGDRAPNICQAQSLNIFLKGGSKAQEVSDLHIYAWKRKVKSLYYLRSSAVNRADTSNNERKSIILETSIDELVSDACTACG